MTVPDGELIAMTTYNRDKQTVVVTRAEPSRGAPDAAHTPGPWRVAVDSYGIERIWAIDDGDQCDVACCEGDGSIPHERRQANARLIAQAPTLLEALKNTTQTLRLMLAGNPTYPAEARAEVRKEIAEAEAAIHQSERT